MSDTKSTPLLLPKPLTLQRVESGPIQFGEDDWPGVFIRGDHALMFAFVLSKHVKRIEESDDHGFFDAQVIKGLIDSLKACKVE